MGSQCTLPAWQLELLEVVRELVLHNLHQALPVSSCLEGREPGHLIPFCRLRSLYGNFLSLHQVGKKVDILWSKAVERFQIVLHEGLALEVVVFLDILLGVRELALDVVFFDLHPPLDCVVVLCEQQGNFALLQLGVFHTREDGCQSGNEILHNRMREQVSRAPEGSAQHRGIPRWKSNKGHPEQCRSDLREGSTKITRNSRVCWRPRVEGLGQFISFHLILAFRICIMKVASF